MGARSVKDEWLLSPALPAWQKPLVAELRRRVPADSGTVWVLSSGTQSVGQVKAIGLSRAALEASARAVNTHLKATSKDRWLTALPVYHVGGYSIALRARLSKSQVFRLSKWSTKGFVTALERHKITLCSLVPTQIFDLVKERVRAPKSLRAIVVGGGALDEGLYKQARLLGWPLLPSYGLTETASQVATAALETLRAQSFPQFTVLPHAELKLKDGRIWIRAESLCHWIAIANAGGQFTLEDPRRDGWLRTEDLGEVAGGKWKILGRADDVVKVLGVLVSLPQVESELREFLSGRDLRDFVSVIARQDERQGHALIAVTDSSYSLRDLGTALDEFNERQKGPWRVQQLLWVNEIPRGDLGKVKKAELRARLQIP